MPAIIEALQQSRWHNRVEVVPCEADARCLDPTCTQYDIILTGDSDLVIHPSPAKVVFFSEIKLRSTQRSKSSPMISGKLYSSHVLAARLGLAVSDFPQLAYYLLQSKQISLAAAADVLKSNVSMSDAQSTSYQRHLQAFAAETSLAAIKAMSRWSKPLQTLAGRADPRVSNLVEQCLLSKRVGDSGARLYLGTIFDYPPRASAWQASTAIRQLCYSVLAVYAGNRFNMLEIDRRGTRATESNVPLLSANQTYTEAGRLADHIIVSLASREVYNNNTETACWRLLAIRSALFFEHSSQRDLPGKQRVLNLMLGAQTQHSWEDLHLSAQAEGVLYSLRILKQVLEIVTEYSKSNKDCDPVHSTIIVLSETLKPMPSIRQLMPSPFAALIVKMSAPYLLKQLAMFYNDEAPTTELSLQTDIVKGSKQVKAPEDGDLADTMASMTLSKNPYNVLGVEVSSKENPVVLESDKASVEGSSSGIPLVVED